MSRDYDRQEALRVAAERMRLKKEKEAQEDKEFYNRITSGIPWIIFKSIVVFCVLLAVITTIEVLADGKTKKLTEDEWKINRDWEWTWHKVLDVEGYMFSPLITDWGNRVENTLEITYSPIFRTGKKLSFVVKKGEVGTKREVTIRERSIFNWFPTFQIFLLIPLLTYLFRRQSPWFNFARIFSMVFVFPGALLITYFTLLQ